MIESKNISVVIQGAASRETIILIRSIRKYLPESEIVLSTWKGSELNDFDCDKLILNEDPGAISAVFDKTRPYNLNRQIVSTRNGICVSTRPYVLKLRSDMELKGSGFLAFWDQYQKRDQQYVFAKHKIIIPALYTIKGEYSNGKFHPTPFHISDWFAFGTKADIAALFSVPLVDAKEFSRYFVYHPKPREYNIPWLNERYWRFPPEQYFGVCYARKWNANLNFSSCLSYDEVDFNASERFLVNNFIVLETNDSQITLNKNPYYSMSMDLRFCPEHIRKTIYRRFIYETDYQKYCDPAFVPIEDDWQKELDEQGIFNIQSEYEKIKVKEEIEEYDFGIVTPTYRGHFLFIPAYLNSFRKYVTDKEKTPIFFTVNSDEYFEFCNLIEPYIEGLRIHVLIFDTLLEYFEIEEKPDQLINQYGRFSFQTLKKYYTMLYVKKSQYLVLDSESVWIAPTSMKDEIESYFKNPFVPCSPLAIQRKGILPDFAIENVEFVLGCSTSKWCLECFSWFYEAKVLKSMFEKVGSPLQIVKKVYLFEKKKHRNVGVLEILLYTAYLENYHYNKYLFIDLYSAFYKILPWEEFFQYAKDTNALYNGESGFAEHISRLLTWKNWEPLAKFYKEKHFSIIRCETGSDEDYVLQKKFLTAAGTKILAASQAHRFLTSSGNISTVSSAFPKKGKKWLVFNFWVQLRAKIKWIMLNTFPAYRVAVDTRFKLESFIGESKGNFGCILGNLENTCRKLNALTPSGGNRYQVLKVRRKREHSLPKKR